MSWDLTIRTGRDSIGSLESVQKFISHIFPATRFGEEPCGAEKVRAAESQGIKFPALLRESMISQPARHTAEFDAENVSLRFHFGSENIVRTIGLEVRGGGDPFSFLRKIASIADWQLTDDSNGKPLRLDSEGAGTGWQDYQRMRADFETNK